MSGLGETHDASQACYVRANEHHRDVWLLLPVSTAQVIGGILIIPASRIILLLICIDWKITNSDASVYMCSLLTLISNVNKILEALLAYSISFRNTYWIIKENLYSTKLQVHIQRGTMTMAHTWSIWEKRFNNNFK